MKYRIFKGTDGLFYWNLRAGNNEIIAHGEGYYNRADCLTVIQLVKNSKDAPIEG